MFRLGPPIVRGGVFYRPTSFNPATGGTGAAEVAAPCQFLGAHVLWGSYLGLAPVVPGTENLLIRAGELAGVTSNSHYAGWARAWLRSAKAWARSGAGA